MPNWKKVITSGSDATLNSLVVSSSITGSTLQLTSLPSQASEATSLMIGASGNVGTRELGSNAFNSTAFTTCTGTVTGTGTNNQVMTSTGGTGIQGEANLIFDGNTLEIGGNLVVRSSIGGDDVLSVDTNGAFCIGDPAGLGNEAYIQGNGCIQIFSYGSERARFNDQGTTSFGDVNSHTITGTDSTIAGGSTNTISSSLGFIGGGSTNSINTTAECSFIGGGYNNRVCATACWGTVVGGCSNYVSNDGGTTAGGRLNCNTGACGFIGGGLQNYVQGQIGAVAGGAANCARGNCSFTGGGYSNDAFGAFSTVAGGYNNSACGACSTIGGGQSLFIHSCQKHAVIGGGRSNCITYFSGYTPAAANDGNFINSGVNNCICICTTSGTYNTLGGGQQNKIFANVGNSTIAGGAANIICNTTGFDYGSFIGGGSANCIINGDDSVIVGGSANCIDANDNNFIGGGCFNTGSANFGVIVGGCKNYITSDGESGFIGGGRCNSVCSVDGFIGGGLENTTDTNRNIVIVGGVQNIATGDRSFIGGGQLNTGSGACSGILGGFGNTTSHGCSFIVGVDIETQGTCTTFVNNFAFYAHDNQTPSIDTANTAGELIYVGATSVTAGNVYYLGEPVSGTSSWTLADADAASTATNMLAMAAGTGASNTVGMLIRGFARFTSVFSLTGTTMGSPLYLSTTAGGITTGAPSGTGDIVRVVGHLIDDATEIIYFNPDGAWVEIA